ncbi:poly(R)-hydroxyalkanoic acid synthase subunit PhaE [Variovorax sp. J2P1-59]|uniref:poly(R)-hydroxyalkanoic acid synthase subunit PhaE n=1 Tax=Variovorax flavidus TaxID=3053501 RepID=UPI0025777D28|nr:poly(R)-hydroxyalkanoic acid synthase subunit PhaE [Variovorax sp. J2P1-59]MDM0075500.1 poly(R)-hydroxyalkanoic acid synthase subunit PhaE [Variovorax sp. J2P1-59]
MPSDQDDLDATQASGPLYDWWLDLLPILFGAGSPMPAQPADDAAPLPFPLPQVSQALTMMQQLTGPMFQGYFQSLLQHPKPEEAFVAFQEQMRGQLQKLSEALAGAGQSLSSGGTSAAGWNLMGQPMAMFGQALEPLSLNLERAYGGLADAFGLAPSRELQAAARGLATAALAKKQAQSEYLSLIVAAMAKGSEGLLSRLAEMGQKGETVESLLGLVRLWSRSADEAMHAAMQSPKALEAAARLVRASTQSRQQQQRVVAIASEALNMPTRAEVDDAYREIQELKREMRRLRKSIGVAASMDALPEAATSARIARTPSPTRAAAKRAPAAKRKTSTKATAS